MLALDDFHRPESRPAFITALGQALEAIGFFALTHHGIADALIQQAYQVTHAFFTLPEETKLRYEVPALKG